MEKQITIEKQKKLKNETMFNFKNVSLMKKQLFSLMMAFALVVGLSVSAWAQTDGSQARPLYQFPGSQHEFSITASAGTTTWEVLTYTAPATTASATTTDCNPLTGSGADFTVTWEETASGTYIIRVTDENANGCSTIRDFYVTIAEFDVYVYATDDEGNRISSDDLSDCGNFSPYNPFDNDLDLIFNTETIVDDNATPDGSLNLVRGTSALTRRYVAVELFSADINFANINYYWQFDFTIIGDTDNNFVRAVSQTTGAAVDGDGASFVTVDPIPAGDGGGTRTKIILALDTEVRWGTNISIAMDIAANNTRMSSDGSSWTAGEEPTANYQDGTGTGTYTEAGDPRSNRSETQVIYGAPATSVISVN